MSLFDKLKQGIKDGIEGGKKAVDSIDKQKLKEDLKNVADLVEDNVKKATHVIKEEFEKIDWNSIKDEAIKFGKDAGEKFKAVDIGEIKEMAKNRAVFLGEDFLNQEVMPKIKEKYPAARDLKLNIEEGSISILVSTEVSGIVASAELSFEIKEAMFIGAARYISLTQTSHPEISFDLPAGDLLGRLFGRIIVRALRGKMEKAVELTEGAVKIDGDNIFISLESLEVPKEAEFVLKVVGVKGLIPEQKEGEKGRLKVELGLNKR